MAVSKAEKVIIKSAINNLSLISAAPTEKIIDWLTGYLWDEEEAGEIKDAWIK